MEINVLPDSKNVEIWLSKAEKNDPELRNQLNGIYADWKRKGCFISVYESGDRDLYQSTLDLIAYNKKRLIELKIRKGEETVWES